MAIPNALLTLLVPLMIWSLIWKAFGLWHSARRSHKIWFVAILVLNTLGILPIIYLIFRTDFFKPKCKTKTKKKSKKTKKKKSKK